MSEEDERCSQRSEPDQSSNKRNVALLSSVGGRVGIGARIGVAATSLLLSVLAIEVTFRLIGFDFEQKERLLRDVPIFNRRPTDVTKSSVSPRTRTRSVSRTSGTAT